MHKNLVPLLKEPYIVYSHLIGGAFEISLGRYKATGEQIYTSAQVTRFKITMQGKYFLVEMQHQQNRAVKWKIKEHSNDVDLNKVQEILPTIKEYINFYLHPPHESHADYLRRTKW